jgi:hypothetical protein
MIMGMQWSNKLPEITIPDVLCIKEEHYNLLE